MKFTIYTVRHTIARKRVVQTFVLPLEEIVKLYDPVILKKEECEIDDLTEEDRVEEERKMGKITREVPPWIAQVIKENEKRVVLFS